MFLNRDPLSLPQKGLTDRHHLPIGKPEASPRTGAPLSLCRRRAGEGCVHRPRGQPVRHTPLSAARITAVSTPSPTWLLESMNCFLLVIPLICLPIPVPSCTCPFKVMPSALWELSRTHRHVSQSHSGSGIMDM